MKSLGHRGRVLLWFLGLALLALRSHAVLFKSTGDPSYNTNAPTGALTNSGWQYEGEWGSFLGTPIAPTFFIVAKHVGGQSNQVFNLNGFNYHAISSNLCPDADLAVWHVAETFPSYTPLYTATNEVGKHCIVFGRGTQRGDAVVVNLQTNGWKWGASDGVERWGENDVSSITDGGAGFGQLLRCAFDRNGGSNECHLSVGDSSGAMFVQDGSTWKLAGIHYAVDGYFSTDGTTNTQFDAALMDIGGLWIGSGTDWTFITNRVYDIPSSFYSTRISSNVSWINSVINFEPGNDLRITDIQVVGPDVQISLSTGLNRLYRIDHTSDLVTGVWAAVTNNLVGIGGSVTVTDPGAATRSKQFYRAVLLQ
jgi:hypothetical protein